MAISSPKIGQAAMSEELAAARRALAEAESMVEQAKAPLRFDASRTIAGAALIAAQQQVAEAEARVRDCRAQVERIEDQARRPVVSPPPTSAYQPTVEYLQARDAHLRLKGEAEAASQRLRAAARQLRELEARAERELPPGEVAQLLRETHSAREALDAASVAYDRAQDEADEAASALAHLRPREVAHWRKAGPGEWIEATEEVRQALERLAEVLRRARQVQVALDGTADRHGLPKLDLYLPPHSFYFLGDAYNAPAYLDWIREAEGKGWLRKGRH